MMPHATEDWSSESIAADASRATAECLGVMPCCGRYRNARSSSWTQDPGGLGIKSQAWSFGDGAIRSPPTEVSQRCAAGCLYAGLLPKTPESPTQALERPP